MKSNLHSLGFALFETALYLDGHPNDRRAVEYYDKTKEKYENALEEYECTHGPLSKSSAHATEDGTWQWVNGPWPWQNEKRGN